MNKLNLILLTKSGRCGTIFLQRLFDNHSDILMLPTIFPFYYSWNNLRKPNDTIFTFLESTFSETSLKGILEFISKDAFFEKIKTLLPDNFNLNNSRKESLEIIHWAFYELTLQTNNPKYLFLHEHNICHLDQVLEDYPEHQHIFMIREPKNSYASHLKSILNKHWIRSVASEKNAIYNEQQAQAFVQKKPTQLKYIKIEKMNEQLEPEMIKLCEWLKIPFQKELLTESIMGKSSNENHSAFSSDNSNKNNRWSQLISYREVILVEYLHRDIIKNHYEFYSSISKFSVVAYLFLFLPDLKIFIYYNPTFKAKLEYIYRLWFIRLRFRWLRILISSKE